MISQVQVSRMGAIPSCVLRLREHLPFQIQMTVRMPLSFTPVTADAIRLRIHCDHSAPVVSPWSFRHGPLSACLSRDVYETCTNGYLDRPRWVMVAICS